MSSHLKDGGARWERVRHFLNVLSKEYDLLHDEHNMALSEKDTTGKATNSINPFALLHGVTHGGKSHTKPVGTACESSILPDYIGMPPERTCTLEAWVKQDDLSINSAQSPVVRKPKRRRWSTLLIISPTSNFHCRWDVVLVFGIVYSAFVGPIQISMLGSEFGTVNAISGLVDVIFLTDLILQFFVMYPVVSEFGNFWEQRPHYIAKHYIKTWFVTDFISIIPFDTIGLLVDSKDSAVNKIFRILRVLKMLKMTRISRLSRFSARYEGRVPFLFGTQSLIKFFAILGLITHWLANLWALSLILVSEDEGIPRWIDKFDEKDAMTAVKTKNTPWKLYVVCLYYTTYTITSVGYGDISPANIVEYIVSIFMIIISGVSWAIVLGQVSIIVQNMNAVEASFRSNMDELTVMMTEQKLPKDLCLRVRNFFRGSKVSRNRSRQTDLLQSLSPGLRGEVLLCIHDRWIGQVRLLIQIVRLSRQVKNRTLVTTFMVEVSQRMGTEDCSQDESFGNIQILYIVKRGLFGRKSRILRTGGVWGRDFLLCSTWLLEDPTAQSLTYGEVINLGRQTFIDIVKEFQDKMPELASIVRKSIVWLAVQKAILYEARKPRTSPQVPLASDLQVTTASTM